MYKGSVKYHKNLAEYFFQKAKGKDKNHEWETKNTRGFAEIIFQLLKANQIETAVELLTSFIFLINIIRNEFLEDVFNDILWLFPYENMIYKSKSNEWISFFRENIHILRRNKNDWPSYKIFLQLCAEKPISSYIRNEVENWLSSQKCSWEWLRKINTEFISQNNKYEIFNFEGHSKDLTKIFRLNNDTLISWAVDGKVICWEIRTGRKINEVDTNIGDITNVYLIEEKYIVLTADRRLLFFSNNIELIPNFGLLSENVIGIKVLSDNTIVVWCSNNVIILFTSDGDKIMDFNYHNAEVKGIAETNDNNIISWSIDGTVLLWNRDEGLLKTISTLPNSKLKRLIVSNSKILLATSNSNDQSKDTLIRIYDHSGKYISKVSYNLNRFFHLKRTFSLKYIKFYIFVNPSGSLLLLKIRYLSERLQNIFASLRNRLLISLYEKRFSTITNFIVNTMNRVLSSLYGYISISEDWIGDMMFCKAINDSFYVGITNSDIWDNTDKYSGWKKDENNQGRDREITVFNADGSFFLRLFGHKDRINGLLITKENNIISYSRDGGIILWDNATLAKTKYIGHNYSVLGIIETSSGNYLSWAEDSTIILWNKSGKRKNIYKHHTNIVKNILEIRLNRFVSYTVNGEIVVFTADELQDIERIKWRKITNYLNPASETMQVVGHTESVLDYCEYKKDHVLSWSLDGRLIKWSSLGVVECVLILPKSFKFLIETKSNKIVLICGDNAYRLKDNLKIDKNYFYNLLFRMFYIKDTYLYPFCESSDGYIFIAVWKNEFIILNNDLKNMLNYKYFIYQVIEITYDILSCIISFEFSERIYLWLKSKTNLRFKGGLYSSDGKFFLLVHDQLKEDTGLNIIILEQPILFIRKSNKIIVLPTLKIKMEKVNNSYKIFDFSSSELTKSPLNIHNKYSTEILMSNWIPLPLPHRFDWSHNREFWNINCKLTRGRVYKENYFIHNSLIWHASSKILDKVINYKGSFILGQENGEIDFIQHVSGNKTVVASETSGRRITSN